MDKFFGNKIVRGIEWGAIIVGAVGLFIGGATKVELGNAIEYASGVVELLGIITKFVSNRVTSPTVTE